MPKKYADCSYCGGLIEEQVRTYDTRRNGRLVLVEGVPIGICNQCGEGYLLAEVAEQIDLVIEQKSQPDRLESTPVFSLHSKLTTGTKSI